MQTNKIFNKTEILPFYEPFYRDEKNKGIDVKNEPKNHLSIRRAPDPDYHATGIFQESR